VSALLILVGLIALQRLAELIHAERNTRALLARGAVEIGRGHYPLFVLLHGGLLLAMLAFIPWDRPLSWPMLIVLLVLQLGRLWVIMSLGPYWTTRLITVPDAPLVVRGPYRYVSHPNYLIVAIEVPVLPLVFGAWPLALAFGLPNLALLWWRIRLEDAALALRRG
jgi:methyltransferase